VSLSLGDSNLDGFPDLLPIIVNNDKATPRLVSNVPCSAGVAGCKAAAKRGWKLNKKGTEPLEGITDARGAAFVDLDEDVRTFLYPCLYILMITFQGTLDVMIQRTGKQGMGTVTFIQNNFYYDAFFLKAIGSISSPCTFNSDSFGSF
jgi:integrin alpha FG-GAP repeat containing protein 1